MIAACAVALLGILFATLPFLLSSDTIRAQITAHLESLTGRTVTFVGEPSITFRPFLGIEVTDLMIQDPHASETNAPLLQVGKVQAQLHALPIFLGDVKISQYRLIRPQLSMKVYEDGNANWQFEKGNLKTAFDQVAQSQEAETDITPNPVQFGVFIIVDGVIRYEDNINGNKEIVSGINGTIDWSDTGRTGSITGVGIWNGENVSGNLTIDEPLLLATGGETQISTSLSSEPINFAFTGAANTLSSLFLKGNVQIGSSSVRRSSEFFQINPAQFGSLGEWEISGDLEATSQDMRLSNAQVNIAGSIANGLVNLARNEIEETKIGGTLAFDELDISELITRTSEGFGESLIDSSTTDFSVDLRVSANALETGISRMEQVAASVSLNPSGWAFDISNAQTLGGSLIAKISERWDNEPNQAFLEFSARQIDIDSLSEFFPQAVLGAEGKADIDTNLRSKQFFAGLQAKGLDGSISVRLKEGTLVGIDLPTLLSGETSQSSANGQALDSDSETQFQSSEFKFFLNDGIASISRSRINTDTQEYQLIGSIDLSQGNLAMRAQEITEAGPQPARLFIGGTITDPFVTIQNSSLKNSSDKPTRYVENLAN